MPSIEEIQSFQSNIFPDNIRVFLIELIRESISKLRPLTPVLVFKFEQKIKLVSKTTISAPQVFNDLFFMCLRMVISLKVGEPEWEPEVEGQDVAMREGKTSNYVRKASNLKEREKVLVLALVEMRISHGQIFGWGDPDMMKKGTSQTNQHFLSLDPAFHKLFFLS
ncbi:hypothetical protein LIER_36962 [Lithospermum erythrorhizon]|uniref:Uncharacterized protein n=1 Tax=Lithospermum erythrorhizon TaxID=34254 RepID=A0AAV3PD38_LITER